MVPAVAFVFILTHCDGGGGAERKRKRIITNFYGKLDATLCISKWENGKEKEGNRKRIEYRTPTTATIFNACSKNRFSNQKLKQKCFAGGIIYAYAHLYVVLEYVD